MRLDEISAQPDRAAPSTPIELSKLVQYYHLQDRHEDLKRRLAHEWGKYRLTFGGQPFFIQQDGEHELGKALEDAEQACKVENQDEDHKAELELHVGEHVIDGEHFDFGDFEFTAEIDEMQMVYVGYLPHSDELLMGFDVWVDNNDFDTEWDRFFKRETGMDFDMDDHEHHEAYSAAWKQYTSHKSFVGALYKVTPHFHAELLQMTSGGFYQGIEHTAWFKSLEAVDLRHS